MDLSDIEKAKNTYLEGYNLYSKASKAGDFKTSNKMVTSLMNPAIEYLKEKDQLKILIPYLEQNEDIGLKHVIAVALLPHYEEICVHALEYIVERNVSNSFNAKMVLEQWRKS